MFNELQTLILLSSAQQRTLSAKIGWIIWFCIFAAIIFLGFLFSFVFTGEKLRKKKLSEHCDNNVRIYSYNYASQTFYYFDKRDFSNTKTLTKDEFLAQFTAQDKYLVDDWLSSIARNENPNIYIQADIKLSKAKKITSIMLEFTSINRQKNIIHFNSHLLSNIYQASPKNHFRKKIKINSKFMLENMEVAQKFVSHGSLDAPGAVFFFKLYSPNADASIPEQSKDIEKLHQKLKLQLSRFLTNQRKVLFLGPNETMIIDIGCVSKIMAVTIASTIQTSLQQVINTNESNENYQIALGISTGTYYERNVQLAKEQTSKMAEAIIKGLTKERSLFYDKAFFYNYQQNQQQKDEVKMVIKNATLKNYFIPTWNLTTKKQDFYILLTKPYGTNLCDFDSVLSLAKEMDSSTILFDAVIKKVLSVIKTRKSPIKIAIKISYSTLASFMRSNEKNKDPRIQWILLLSETDILTSVDDANLIAKTFHDFSKQGYQIGLVIEHPMPTLRTRILKTVSYFFVPPNFTMKASEENSGKTELRNIQAGYNNSIYRVPLVYYGLKDFDDIELGVHYGGSIFQCDELALPSSHIENIDSETIEEIINDTKTLGPKSILDNSFIHRS